MKDQKTSSSYSNKGSMQSKAPAGKPTGIKGGANSVTPNNGAAMHEASLKVFKPV